VVRTGGWPPSVPPRRCGPGTGRQQAGCGKNVWAKIQVVLGLPLGTNGSVKCNNECCFAKIWMCGPVGWVLVGVVNPWYGNEVPLL
jgi:hypothetical protein